MRKIFLAVITITFANYTVMSQDFRKATWGMSPSEVKSTESKKPTEENSKVIVYETTLAGYEVLLGYVFTDNKLTRARYIIKEYHSNHNDYISDYQKLNGLLKKKYGEPIEDKTFWKEDDSIWKDNESDWGHAISRGELTLYSTYSSPNTEIEITLSAEDYKIINIIDYSSTSAELNSIEEEKTLEDF